MAPSINPSLFSGWLGYDNGPVTLRYTFEAHFDYFGMSQLGGSPGATNTNRSSTDLGHRFVASYSHAVPDFTTRLVGVFEYLSYKEQRQYPRGDRRARARGVLRAGRSDAVRQAPRLGRVRPGARRHVLVRQRRACSTHGLGATQGVLGYIYRFSKTTDLYAAAYRISNQSSASYSTFPPLGGPAAPGVDVEAFGVACCTRSPRRCPADRTARPHRRRRPPRAAAPPPAPAAPEPARLPPPSLRRLPRRRRCRTAATAETP